MSALMLRLVVRGQAARRRWFQLATAVLVLVLVGLIGYFAYAVFFVDFD